jgi:hypothetical protein
MENLDSLTKSWNQADNDYKSTLFKNALLILSAELAIIGFLLQNEQTQTLMKNNDLKLIFIVSFVFASISFIASVLYKRFYRAYSQHSMHIEQYVTMGGKEITVFGLKFKLKDSTEEKEMHTKSAVKAIAWAEKVFTFAEICLGASVIAGALFVGALLYHL